MRSVAGGMETRAPFVHRHHRVAQRCLNRFEPVPRRSGPGLIPKAQTLGTRLSSPPDVTLMGAFAPTQGWMEQTDPACWRDTASRRHPACTDRHARRHAPGVA